MKMDFKLESRQLIWDYLLLTVGALLTAFAFAAFFVTNDIAPGGTLEDHVLTLSKNCSDNRRLDKSQVVRGTGGADLGI